MDSRTSLSTLAGAALAALSCSAAPRPTPAAPPAETCPPGEVVVGIERQPGAVDGSNQLLCRPQPPAADVAERLSALERRVDTLTRRPPPARPRPAAAPSERGRASDDAIKKVDAYTYEVERTMLDEQLSDLSQLALQARIVPNYRGGKYQGFKLVGVRPGSLYRALGIRSGDVIKAVNGRAIDTPNKAVELFEQLKKAARVTLDIERRGQDRQLVYMIR